MFRHFVTCVDRSKFEDEASASASEKTSEVWAPHDAVQYCKSTAEENRFFIFSRSLLNIFLIIALCLRSDLLSFGANPHLVRFPTLVIHD